MRVVNVSPHLEIKRLRLECLRQLAKPLVREIKRLEVHTVFEWQADVMFKDLRRKLWLHEFSVGGSPWWLENKPMIREKENVL